jgi:hypothetical protein
MLSPTAARSVPDSRDNEYDTITTPAELAREGWSESAIRAQLRARRWQRQGRALLRHNAVPGPAELRRIALINCGPRAVLTAFTAAEELGLAGWQRETLHVLVPGGTHVRRIVGVALRVHYASRWDPEEHLQARRLHKIAPALVTAAGTFLKPRPACGILAAGVQQRLVSADQLSHSLGMAPCVKHHAVLLAAVRDIGQGAEALSEIDFARLCRRFSLPRPTHQAVRVEPSGRRRYLDAEWTRADGRCVAAEVDGALHLAPRRWWDDQFRQNELTISGALVLRFPTVVVRTEPALVADQLRRALRV